MAYLVDLMSFFKKKTQQCLNLIWMDGERDEYKLEMQKMNARVFKSVPWMVLSNGIRCMNSKE